MQCDGNIPAVFTTFMRTRMVDMLANEGNGAVQVEESPNKVPPIIMLAGPIKIWWSEWDSPRHQEYTKWRDAVRVAFVKAGFAVYSPHRAIQGRWNEKLQDINNAAILASDFVIVLTPPEIPADGTCFEIEYATKHGINVLYLPPSTIEDIEHIIMTINKRMPMVSFRKDHS